jgi:hypothetical protein
VELLEHFYDALCGLVERQRLSDPLSLYVVHQVRIFLLALLADAWTQQQWVSASREQQRCLKVSLLVANTHACIRCNISGLPQYAISSWTLGACSGVLPCR